MKTVYHVVWTRKALNQLRDYFNGLISQFDDHYNAQRFYNTVIEEAENLSFLADVYRFKKEIIIKKYYKISFDVLDDTVYIFSFIDMRRVTKLH